MTSGTSLHRTADEERQMNTSKRPEGRMTTTRALMKTFLMKLFRKELAISQVSRQREEGKVIAALRTGVTEAVEVAKAKMETTHVLE